MSTQIIPYDFERALPVPHEIVPIPGQCQGVYFTLPVEMACDLLAKIEGWFAGREEVVLVDAGTTDKTGLGFVLLEWQECAIDPLFLAILRDEDLIADYTVYSRRWHEEG